MNPIELLQTVNSFYDQAFNRLLVITFGLIAFIGIFVPLVTGWLQLKSLRAEKAALLAELRLQLDTERDALAKEVEKSVEERFSTIESAYEEKIDNLSEQLEIAYAIAEARSFHLQGRSNLKNHPARSIEDFCHATAGYLDGKDEANAQTCARVITENCLPRISSEEYKSNKIEKFCTDTIECLRKHNENGRYQHFIDRMERAMDSASTRDAVGGGASNRNDD